MLSNVTLRKQYHKARGRGMTLFPQGYIGCVAHHTGQHLSNTVQWQNVLIRCIFGAWQEVEVYTSTDVCYIVWYVIHRSAPRLPPDNRLYQQLSLDHPPSLSGLACSNSYTGGPKLISSLFLCSQIFIHCWKIYSWMGSTRTRKYGYSKWKCPSTRTGWSNTTLKVKCPLSKNDPMVNHSYSNNL